MNTYEIINEYFNKNNILNTPLPNYLEDFIQVIDDNETPDKMKLLLTITNLFMFVSQFQRNILLDINNLIPINCISFCLAPSGIGKDKSFNQVNKLFANSYTMIQDKKKKIGVALAKEKSKQDGEKNWKKLYEEPYGIFSSISTPEGFLKHLAQLEDLGLGAGVMVSSEIGSEMLTGNSNLIPCLTLLSELYDEGKKDSKVIKDSNNQTKSINNLPVSALLMGSPENILLDEATKRKFKIEFASKLSRRCFFNYNKFKNKEREYKSIDEIIKVDMNRSNKSNEIILRLISTLKSITEEQIDKRGVALQLDEKAKELFYLYRRYNSYISDTIELKYSLAKITAKHLYWKALKLSGVFAILNGRDIISELDYKQAITFCEMYQDDLKEFEKELIKEPYEVFVSYIQTKVYETNQMEIVSNIHFLKKLGFIIGNTNIKNKLKELSTLASSLDESGIYTSNDNSITYKRIIKTNVLNVTCKKCVGTKEERAKKLTDGFERKEVEFKHLADLLRADYAYTPFKFENGKRGDVYIKDTSIKWVALDIDNSVYYDYEIHEILQDLNHHIARTSDKDNPKKFRLLIELDSPIELTRPQYKKFIFSIANQLGLDVDLLPMSQIYYSYKDREVLSVVDKAPLSIKEHYLYAINNDEHLIEFSSLTDSQKKALLKDKLTTFRYAYEAKQGEGSKALYRAFKHAKDLRATPKEIEELILDINDYWTYPMDIDRLNKTILNQVRRLSGTN